MLNCTEVPLQDERADKKPHSVALELMSSILDKIAMEKKITHFSETDRLFRKLQNLL